MKDKLNKLLDPSISKKEEDLIFEEIMKKKHDQDLKTKWREILSTKYGINKESIILKKKNSTSKIIKIFLATAACISLIVAFQFFYNTPPTPYTIAQHYINNQEILHPGASKGITEENQNRILAIHAFNNKNYRQSIKYFQNLNEANDEDVYYYGLALLLNNQYPEAIQKFESNNNDNRFREEINWYQSLAYILDKQNAKAKIVLEQINKTDWNYTQAQELLQKLDSNF